MLPESSNPSSRPAASDEDQAELQVGSALDPNIQQGNVKFRLIPALHFPAVLAPR
jgi:hypothetical protein